MKPNYDKIYFELPLEEKKLLEDYCKHMQQTKTEVLRGLIKQLSYPEGVPYGHPLRFAPSERCHWLLKLELGKTHAAILDEYCKSYGVVPSEAVRQAIILLAQHYVLSVEAKDAEAFVAAIENPPEPSEALIDLMRTEAPWNELKQRDNLTPISKSEIRPWLQSLVDEAEQDLAIADQLRTMGEQLLAIAKVIEDR